jgi:hypothetical protein
MHPSVDVAGRRPLRRIVSKDLGTAKKGIMGDNQPFIENKDASALAQAIVDTVRLTL